MLTKLIGIRSTPAQLSISNSQARLQISNQASTLEIQRTPAAMQIQRTPLTLSIDSTTPRQEMGYYDMLALLQELVAYSKRQCQRGIQERVNAGLAVSDSTSGSNVIASLAVQRMFVDMNDRQFIVTMIPRTPPAISITPGQLQIDAGQAQVQVQITPHAPMISVEAERPQIEVTPGSVTMFTREPGTLDLTA